MNRAIGLGLAAGAAVLQSGCIAAEAEKKAQKQPNIIYILADDLGYRELGCYGQTKIKTPNIDKIAAEGVKFTQHYSGQAVCAPSRCVLLTGKHTGHSYVRDNRERKPEGQIPLPAGTFNIASMLKTKGYATACVGKWGLGFPGSVGDPNNQGFDLFYGYNCQRQAHSFYPEYLWKNDKKVQLPGNKPYNGGPHYSADLMTTEALQFIRESKDKPFFLYYASPIPHVSLEVTQDMVDMYKGKWDEEEKPYDGKKGYIAHKNPRSCYAGMISHLDRDVGRIINLLKELDLEDDTLIIFTSDNGATFCGGVDYKFFKSVGELRGLKGSLWEGGIRVPLVAKWPGKIRPGTTSDHISAFQDMLPTFAEITTADIPKDIDGKSMLAALTGKEQQEHEHLYWEFPARYFKGQQAVRMGKWKAIRRNLNKQPEAPIQLFNLETDIGESNDVASEFPEVVTKIREIMKKEHTPSKEFPFKALDK